MVKGTTRQVIVVKPSDTKLYEQAIFLLKEDALERHGITEGEFLEEVQRLCETHRDKAPKKKVRSRALIPLLWSGLGAVVTGFLWLLSVL